MFGALNMNGRIVYGLPIDYPPNYNGGEAVSWRQLAYYVDEKLRSIREYVDSLQHKPVISVTAYPVITNSTADYWGFYGGQDRGVDGYKTLTTGRSIKIYIYTSSHEVISTRVRILGGSTEQHVITKRELAALSQTVSMEFFTGSTISLTIMDGRAYIREGDRVTLLLELDV